MTRKIIVLLNRVEKSYLVDFRHDKENYHNLSDIYLFMKLDRFKQIQKKMQSANRITYTKTKDIIT